MRRALAAVTIIALATLAAAAGASGPTAPGGGWLDRPLTNWNRPGAALPRAVPSDAESAQSPRCRELARPPSLPVDRVLARAGWTPVGPAQVYGGTVVVAAMTNVDGMCRPLNYQEFVFVDGQFAGTLSPVAMDSRTDGAASTVRLVGAASIFAEFLRYAPEDPLCCPSRITRVTYRLERGGRAPLVVPVAASTDPTQR